MVDVGVFEESTKPERAASPTKEGEEHPSEGPSQKQPQQLQQQFVGNDTTEEDAEYGVLRDTRDEDTDSYDYDDPYVYSDDSASLSDAYFFPQSDDDLARPPRYREDDPLKTTGSSVGGSGPPQHYPVASYYGSLQGADRSSSPLWVGGSIQEDAELQSPAQQEQMSSLVPNEGQWRDRKRQRRQQRRLQQKQRERISRERAVAQVRGKMQNLDEWKDPIFAVLFIVQLVAIFACATRFGYELFLTNPNWFQSILPRNHTGELLFHHHSVAAVVSTLVTNTSGTYGSTDSMPTTGGSVQYGSTVSSFAFTIDYKNVIALVSVSGFYACVLTYLSFGFMLILARALIQIMLVFSVLLALAWGVIGLTLDPYGVISILGFASLLLTLGYALASWNRIPFAATNLHTALCAMRCTADITILGLVSLLVAFGWCVVWTMAFVGLVNSFNSAECTKSYACEPHVNNGPIPLYIALLFSFHWTNMVIKNIVRVTVASVVGTWWFSPNDIGPFCTSAVTRPLFRSLTKSLGSICLGSLVVQPARMLSSTIRCCCYVLGLHDNCLYSSKENAVAHTARNEKTMAVSIAPSHYHDDSDGHTDCARLCPILCCFQERCRALVRSSNRWSFTYIGICECLATLIPVCQSTNC